MSSWLNYAKITTWKCIRGEANKKGVCKREAFRDVGAVWFVCMRVFFGESVGNDRPRGDVRRIRRQRGQPSVLYRSTHGEMVKGLVFSILETEDVMNRIIEEASDPGATNTGGLGFEIEDCTDHPGLTEKPSEMSGAGGR